MSTETELNLIGPLKLSGEMIEFQANHLWIDIWSKDEVGETLVFSFTSEEVRRLHAWLGKAVGANT